MTFAQKLSRLLDEKGWSVNRLATESGVPYTTLKSYFQSGERTSRVPSYPNALAICRALGVAAYYFGDCDDVKLEKKKRAKKTGRRKPDGKSTSG